MRIAVSQSVTIFWNEVDQIFTKLKQNDSVAPQTKGEMRESKQTLLLFEYFSAHQHISHTEKKLFCHK